MKDIRLVTKEGREIRLVPRGEFREYMYAPPLDVPPGYDPNAAYRKGSETGDWSDYEVAARKVCRLILESAQKSQAVMSGLLTTMAYGDEAWNNLLVAMGTETPEIAEQINQLQLTANFMNWAVFSAAYLLGQDL